MQDATKCGHEPCTCTVREGAMENEDGERCCSAGCATGEGCDCPECGCGDAARAVEAPGAVPPL